MPGRLYWTSTPTYLQPLAPGQQLYNAATRAVLLPQIRLLQLRTSKLLVQLDYSNGFKHSNSSTVLKLLVQLYRATATGLQLQSYSSLQRLHL